MMIICQGWRPLVSESRSRKPVGTPMSPSPRLALFSISALISAADQFVADFIGLNRAQRRFRLETTPRGTMVIDGEDRPAGYLADGEGSAAP